MSSLLEDKEKSALTKSSDCKETHLIGIHTAYVIWYQCGGRHVVLSQVWKVLGFCSPAFWCRQQPFLVHSTRLGSLHQARCNVPEGKGYYTCTAYTITPKCHLESWFTDQFYQQNSEKEWYKPRAHKWHFHSSLRASHILYPCILFISFKEPTLITSRFCAGLMQWSLVHDPLLVVPTSVVVSLETFCNLSTQMLLRQHIIMLLYQHRHRQLAGGHRSMLSKNKYLLAMMDGRFAGATGRAFLTL